MTTEKSTYISLQEASSFCDYSQEYLSLRARQGKLKAVKFGRNWVTKKEWLEEYLKKVKKNTEVGPLQLFEVRPGFGFVVALAFVLIVAGIVFGKESFKNVFEDIKPYTYIYTDTVHLAAISAQNVFQSTLDIFKEYGQWVGDQASAVGQGIVKSYIVANEFVEQKISITRGRASEAWQMITRAWRERRVVQEVPPEITPEITQEELAALQTKLVALKQEFEKFKKEPVVIQRIEIERRIEPIREVIREIEKVKEITKIDDQALAQLNAQIQAIQKWETDLKDLRAITAKLQAHPAAIAVPTAPIFIGTPGIQVGGHGTFISLGVSGLVSIGQGLGVGGSTVLGSTSADRLTVNAASHFRAPATFGAGTLVIDTLGNLTTTGNIITTGGGDLIVSGDITLAGALTINGHPVRPGGEEVARAAVPIFRYSVPAQTSATAFARVSRHFSATTLINLPPALTGTTRVYRLAIKYADDIATPAVSDWRIFQPGTAASAATFQLPGQGLTDFKEGRPHLTGLVSIPATDWQIEARVPAGRTIRIFQIYLIAFDRIN